MSEIFLCRCGCGQPTKIATRTRTERNQKKGFPLLFINGHNARLFGSEEQKRRASMQSGDFFRYTGCRTNYVKKKGRHMHRVVAEEMLGRALNPGEIVHHKDGDKWNNDPSNLEVMTQAEHARIHRMIRWHGESRND